MGRQKKGCSSLAARVLEFFEANPDEELTRADMKVKFSAGESNLSTALSELRDQVESVHIVRLRTKGMGRAE